MIRFKDDHGTEYICDTVEEAVKLYALLIVEGFIKRKKPVAKR